MNERDLKSWMAERNLSILEGDTRPRAAACMEAVKRAIPPRTVSERTTQMKVYKWMYERAKALPEERLVEFLRRLIDLAIEASGPACRVPGAVFMSNLKKQFGYPQ